MDLSWAALSARRDLLLFADRGRMTHLIRPIPGCAALHSSTSASQMRTLYTLIAGSDPRQLSFEFALWTREMVRTVIRGKFDVAVSKVSVGRMLRTLGLSPQRPLHRAYQQDPDAVAHWKTAEYPRVRAAAAREGATVYFADEAGIRSDYHSGTTWAPVGDTPVVERIRAQFSVNMLSAVTPAGTLRFMVTEGTTTAEVFIDFCQRLLHDADGPVYLIVDGHPAHRAKATKEFVASTDGQLTLIFPPGYSPQLNPDEWVWKNVKHDQLGHRDLTSRADLKTRAIGALQRLQKLPRLVRAFFADPNLRYITE